jgi:DNA-binding response OmpR family regulator
MNSLNILSLEDDANLNLVMSQYFEDEGHYLIQVNTGQKCLEKIQSKKFDILLMDLGLPDMDGLSLIPQIKQWHKGPIIVVSGKSSTTDRIVGLEMGADDYIVKPFEMRELMARIKANVRKTQQNNAQQDFTTEEIYYKFDGYTYNLAKMELMHCKDGQVNITSGECELLKLFLDSHGRVLSREYLHENTKGDSYETFDRSVDVAVTRLRKKLNDDCDNQKIIKTVRGVGYMFVADIEKTTA